MRWVLLPLVLLVACEKGPEADLRSISEARSLGAEWALVNDQAAKGQLTDAYVKTMRKQLREQLREIPSSLAVQDSRYADEIRALGSEPAEAPPKQLQSHADKLRQIEDDLESD